jgi:hypothetical protein
MLGAKVMKKELSYLASKRWVKVGRQELRSTPYKQEIHPNTTGQNLVTPPPSWSCLSQLKIIFNQTREIITINLDSKI